MSAARSRSALDAGVLGLERRRCYAWRPGYWGPHVGFYGGVNYGFGYFGTAYVGGGLVRQCLPLQHRGD